MENIMNCGTHKHSIIQRKVHKKKYGEKRYIIQMICLFFIRKVLTSNFKRNIILNVHNERKLKQ